MAVNKKGALNDKCIVKGAFERGTTLVWVLCRNVATRALLRPKKCPLILTMTGLHQPPFAKHACYKFAFSSVLSMTHIIQ